MELGPLVQTIAIYALPVLFAITLHEAAHGYVARHFGDLTAYAQGRISLNPLRHIDPVGTIVVPLLILAMSTVSGFGGFIFGWAKPVPVNFSALRKPRQHMALVAVAGPGANLAMAQFDGRARLTRIVAGGHNAAAQAPIRVLKAAHVIALPAVEAYCDLTQPFKRPLRIYAQLSVTLACLLICCLNVVHFMSQDSSVATRMTIEAGTAIGSTPSVYDVRQAGYLKARPNRLC